MKLCTYEVRKNEKSRKRGQWLVQLQRRGDTEQVEAPEILALLVKDEALAGKFGGGVRVSLAIDVETPASSAPVAA